MRDTPPHLKPLEDMEKTGIPGLVEVLREEGLDTVRYVLWDATGWHRDLLPLGMDICAKRAGKARLEVLQHYLPPKEKPPSK